MYLDPDQLSLRHFEHVDGHGIKAFEILTSANLE